MLLTIRDKPVPEGSFHLILAVLASVVR